MKIDVIHEDDGFIAVNKPAGIVVHSDGKSSGPFLTDWFVSMYPDAKGVGEPLEISTGEIIERHGVVHRLDKETSGIILLAKNRPTYRFLKRSFKERNIQKTYRAWVYGTFKDDRGIIDIPIGRNPNDFRKRLAHPKSRGVQREARTRWHVLKRGADSGTGEQVSLLDVFPETGRTHQIRVHLQAKSHPVLCDPLYANGRLQLLGFNRLALHAYSLALTTKEGERITITAPLPEDFVEAEKNLVAEG